MKKDELIEQMSKCLQEVGSERFAYYVSNAIDRCGPRGDGGCIAYYHKAVASSLKEFGEMGILDRNGIGPFVGLEKSSTFKIIS